MATQTWAEGLPLPGALNQAEAMAHLAAEAQAAAIPLLAVQLAAEDSNQRQEAQVRAAASQVREVLDSAAQGVLVTAVALAVAPEGAMAVEAFPEAEGNCV